MTMLNDSRFVVDLYLRVSTDRQVNEGDSLDEQENELKKYCEFRGFDIHHTLIEKGRSGGNTDRPEYQRLIEDVKQKRINAVVVKKLDRLSRSLLDFEQLMTLLNENDVEFISLKESFDTTSAMGKAMLRVALVFAQLEREQTSERLLDVLEYRAKKGIYNGGTRPYGYANVNKELVPYPKEKEVVEVVYKTFLECRSTAEVEQVLNNRGYRTRSNKAWDRRLIDIILRNPVYIGKLKWGGAYYNGLHLPIISEDIFNQVQRIFKSRKYSQRGEKIKSLLKGILFCTCGAEMKPNYTKNSVGRFYYYYRCSTTINSQSKSNCGLPYQPMDEVDYQVISRIKACATDQYLNSVQARMKAHNSSIQEFIKRLESEIEIAKRELSDTQKKKETYFDSLISKDFSAKERQLINEKIDEFTLREKEYTASIHRLNSDLSDKLRQLLSIDELKRELLHFKVNLETLSDKEREAWIHDNISRVEFTDQEQIKICFKLLDEME